MISRKASGHKDTDKVLKSEFKSVGWLELSAGGTELPEQSYGRTQNT